MNEPIFTIRIDFGFGIDSAVGEGLYLEQAAEEILKNLLSREKVSQVEIDAIDKLASQFEEVNFWYSPIKRDKTCSEHEGYRRIIESCDRYHTFMGDYLVMKSYAVDLEHSLPIENHPANFYYFEKVG